MPVIKFFASVKDKMKRDSMTLRIQGPMTLRNALALAETEAGAQTGVLIAKSLRYAVNHDFVEGLDVMVNENDEIAVLPPLSGGV